MISASHNSLSLTLIVLLTLLFFQSCRESCIKDKETLLKQHESLISAIKQQKLKHTDEAWNHYDARFRKIVLECHPNPEIALNVEERHRFWRANMGYVYLRYGIQLIKKFKSTDQLIQVVRDSLDALDLSIAEELDLLQKEWPVLINLDPYSKERLISYFEKEDKHYLLPTSDSIIRETE